VVALKRTAEWRLASTARAALRAHQVASGDCHLYPPPGICSDPLLLRWKRHGYAILRHLGIRTKCLPLRGTSVAELTVAHRPVTL